MENVQIPVCRELYYHKIIESLSFDLKFIVITGPISSGKTKTIESIIANNVFKCRTSHVFCNTGMEFKHLLSKISDSLITVEKKPKSWSIFADYFRNFDKTIIFIDAFDLLGDNARDIFTVFKSSADNNLLPFIQFVIISRCPVTALTSDPFSCFTINFPAYTREETEIVVMKNFTDIQNEEQMKYLRRIMSLSEALTLDVRDLIYVCHCMRKRDIQLSDPDFVNTVVEELQMIHHETAENKLDLPRVCLLLLCASFIAMRTSNLSDLYRLSKQVNKRKRVNKNFSESHEYVSLERVFAISQALNYHHCDNFEMDFSSFIHVNTLINLNMLEIRGDIRQDPKVKCLASEEDVMRAAEQLNINIVNYIE